MSCRLIIVWRKRVPVSPIPIRPITCVIFRVSTRVFRIKALAERAIDRNMLEHGCICNEMTEPSDRQRTRLALLDDHGLFRESLGHLLASEPDFEVVGQCSTSAEALELLDGTAVDQSEGHTSELQSLRH